MWLEGCPNLGGMACTNPLKGFVRDRQLGNGFKLAARAMRSLTWHSGFQHVSKDPSTEMQLEVAAGALRLANKFVRT